MVGDCKSILQLQGYTSWTVLAALNIRQDSDFVLTMGNMHRKIRVDQGSGPE